MALGPKQGAYLLSAFRVRAGWGEVSEQRWPYYVASWPPAPPVDQTEIDRIAGYNRLPAYFAVRSVSEAKAALTAGLPFQLTVPITEQWYKAPGGMIELPLSAQPGASLGNHAIPVLDFDDERGGFLFLNSWGRRWGDEGWGFLPYSYMSLYMVEAWCGIPAVDHRPHLPEGAHEVFLGEFETPDGRPFLQLGIYGAGGAKVGWCLASEREGYLEVEDFFVKPEYGPHHVVQLARELITLADRRGRKLRFWIPHCDAVPTSYNHARLSNVIAGLELRRRPTVQRWAHAVAD